MTASALLSVSHLQAGYNNKNVVDDVSFEIHPGEIFGLVGLNGAGKTTLIKTILGLRNKKSGEILSQNDSEIAYLPEKFEPTYFLSGEKFIQFSLKLYRKTISSEALVKAAYAVSFNTEFLAKNVQTYSKGMRQKIGLLATMLSDSKLLVLDEPMSGLDPRARQDIKKMIRAVKEQGRSVFMSSHILADISELCDRVAVFHNNRIVFIGTPEEMQARGNNSNLEIAFLNIIDGDKESLENKAVQKG